jgi:hypothetical protein
MRAPRPTKEHGMSEPSASSSATKVRSGALALTWTGKRLPLQVLRSAAGHYIGTQDDEGPVSRESVEYFPNHLAAQRALDTHAWTQRAHP